MLDRVPKKLVETKIQLVRWYTTVHGSVKDHHSDPASRETASAF